MIRSVVRGTFHSRTEAALAETAEQEIVNVLVVVNRHNFKLVE